MVAFIVKNPARYVKLDLVEYTFFESSIGTISLASRNKKIIALDIHSKNLYEVKETSVGPLSRRKRIGAIIQDNKAPPRQIS